MAAANSSARPGPKNESVASSEPSTVTIPFATVDAPPAFQGVLVQPVGRDAPPNSLPTVGASTTSPSPACARYVPEPSVPAPKSPAVVSTSFARDVVNDNGVAVGSVVGFPDPSIEVTR